MDDVGSFDSPHIDHFDIIKRSSILGKLSIGIGINPEKKFRKKNRNIKKIYNY